MNKIICIFLFCFATYTILGQSLPANRYYSLSYLFDDTTQNPSMAYSLRKLSKTYAGFAVKVRRSADNAEVNVAFDANDVVASTSNVTVTFVGTSSLTIGQVLSYATFVGASTIFVTTWYDQGPNAYHATQVTNSIQPTLVLNSAGPSNSLPSILFDGTAPPDYLNVNQPIQNLTTTGINGSLLLVCKPTQNTSQLSFGTQIGATWRWSIHLNWSDSNCYFDAAENCCAINRAFANGGNINLYKQYSYIRGATYKTVRINSLATGLNNSAAASTAQTGGSFFIGAWSGFAGSTGFFGNTSEVIMFPIDLSIIQLSPIEFNEKLYWGL